MDAVAVVTEGNRGLGIVRTLAQWRTRVVLTSRSVTDGRAVIGMLGDLADRVAVRQLDVTDTDSVERFAAWLRMRLGRCDVLVNNAVMLADTNAGAGAIDADLAVVRASIDVNLLGTWRLTQALVPLMRQSQSGSIVNVVGSPDHASYRVVRDAIGALTRIMAEDLAADGILVNVYPPDAASAGVSVSVSLAEMLFHGRANAER